MEIGFRLKLYVHIEGDSYVMLLAGYTLSHHEKRRLCEFLTSVKYPDSFPSNISRCVKTKDYNISGMKSHDFHIFLQCKLPIAIC